MLVYPTINPVALALGPLKIHWYGLMYLVGFFGAWGLANWRAKRSHSDWTAEQIEASIFYAAMGVLLGGRLGYVLFYNFPQFMAHPADIFKVWEGGMSFHGGLLGVLTSLWLYSRKYHRPFFQLTDFVAPLVPLGLAAGRIGNFINGELWGRVADVPLAMVFPTGGPLPRHPSQLYEFILEGIVLFIILWLYSARQRPRMAVSGLFLLCYGGFRIVSECFRQPDVQIGYLALDWLTMGQLLSLPMVLIGSYLMWQAYGRADK